MNRWHLSPLARFALECQEEEVQTVPRLLALPHCSNPGSVPYTLGVWGHLYVAPPGLGMLTCKMGAR